MFDWQEFLELAQNLAGRSGEEAALRTAISRAYYATFHSGRTQLAKAGLEIDRSGRAHQQVRDELGRQSGPLQQELVRLHRWRKQADYDDVCSFDVEVTAHDAVALARMTIERIRSLP